MERKPFDPLKVDGLNDVLKNVVKGLGIERRIKENTVLDLWPQIVGVKFQSKTRAVSFRQGRNGKILVVAVESSPFLQEIFLYKNEILKKLDNYTSPLGFKVVDIAFDTKLWNSIDYNNIEITQEEPFTLNLKQYTEEDLEKIELPQSVINPVKASVDGLSFASDELKKTMINTTLRNLKIQIWRKENGYPCCEVCGIPVRYVKENEAILCPACKYSREDD